MGLYFFKNFIRHYSRTPARRIVNECATAHSETFPGSYFGAMCAIYLRPPA